MCRSRIRAVGLGDAQDGQIFQCAFASQPAQFAALMPHFCRAQNSRSCPCFHQVARTLVSRTLCIHSLLPPRPVLGTWTLPLYRPLYDWDGMHSTTTMYRIRRLRLANWVLRSHAAAPSEHRRRRCPAAAGEGGTLWQCCPAAASPLAAQPAPGLEALPTCGCASDHGCATAGRQPVIQRVLGGCL